MGSTLTEKEEQNWEYFENHLYEITDWEIESCCKWVKTDLQLVKSWGNLASKRAQGLLKRARRFALQAAVERAARHLEAEFDFDDLIGETGVQPRAGNLTNNTCPGPSVPILADQADTVTPAAITGSNAAAAPARTEELRASEEA